MRALPRSRAAALPALARPPAPGEGRAPAEGEWAGKGAHPGSWSGVYVSLAKPGGRIHSSWAQDGPGQEQWICLDLVAQPRGRPWEPQGSPHHGA
eukprot:4217446-Pyramimonas_sp.AAC.1